MKRFQNILCVIDPNTQCGNALEQAVLLAEQNQAKLSVIYVLESSKSLMNLFKSDATSIDDPKQLEVMAREAMDKIIQAQVPEPEKINQILFAQGTQFLEVIRQVLSQGFDLVIKCSDNPSWTHRLFGSNDMHLMRKCPCPVLMVKTQHTGPFKQILSTIDVNDADQDWGRERVQEKLNEKVLDHSVALAIANTAKLNIGSVWDAYGEDFLRHGAFSTMPEKSVDNYVEQTQNECSDRLDALVQGMKRRLDKDALKFLDYKSHLIKGQPTDEIPALTKKLKIDLVVMGTVARTGIPGLIIGNTAESILEQVQCSVLAIKPEGFKSPVTLG